MANVSVKLELDSLDTILAKRMLSEKGGANKKMASEVKRLCDPYVPFLSEALKNTAQVLQDGVLYTQPYAAKQYYTNSGSGQDGTGGGGQRGKTWDKRMMADKGGELLKTMAAFVGGEPGK